MGSARSGEKQITIYLLPSDEFWGMRQPKYTLNGGGGSNCNFYCHVRPLHWKPVSDYLGFVFVDVDYNYFQLNVREHPAKAFTQSVYISYKLNSCSPSEREIESD